MKNRLRLFNKVIKMFPDGAFYSCSIETYEMTFQGKFHSDTVKFAKKLRFIGDVDDNGYYSMTRNNMKITLTE